MKTRHLLIAGVASCVSAQAFAQADTASADASSARLGDIVVTAQKRAENLQSVPIAVAAVSAAQLKSTGVVTTQGLANSVAGLSIKVTANYFAPILRGVGSSFFGPGVENPVGLYVDGIYYGSQLWAPTNLSNVSQVAVLKGPQGTLFGRNSTGGVIQMTTREPTAEFGGELSTELDNYLTSRNFAYLTGGLTDGLKTNLSLSYTKQGEGWGKNLTTGNEVKKIYHDFGVRNKWQLDAGDFTAKLNLDYADRKDSMGINNRPLPGRKQALHGLNFDPTNFPFYAFGNPNFSGPSFTSSNPWDVALNVDNRNSYKGGGAGLTLEYDLGLAKLVSITGYRKSKFHMDTDTDGSTDFLHATEYTQRSRQFSQEVQLLSKDNPDFNWVIGGYYFDYKESIFQHQHWGMFGPPFSLFIDPAFGNLQDTFYLTDLTVRTKSLAGFAQATVRLFDETRLTGGIRLTYERRTMHGQVTSAYTHYDGTPAGDDPIFFGTSTISAFLDDQTAGPVNPPALKKTTPTWRVALDHKFTPGILGYVSYNRGYKSGGFNTLQPLSAASQYKPEKVDAYEIGFKMELLDRTLRFNPAFFYNKYKDLQVLNLNDIFANVGNAQKSRMYGLDVEAEWQATQNLYFNFGGEWLNAKFTSFPDLPNVVLLPDGGIVQGTPGLDGKGRYLPFAPKFTFNIGANYTVDVRDAKITFNATDSYNDGYYFTPDNVIRQKAFHLLNASVSWLSPDERLSAAFWGRNLLNKAVPSTVSTAPFVPLPSSGGLVGDFTNPPRTYGVTIGYKFGAR